jgi:hypothetical protein
MRTGAASARVMSDLSYARVMSLRTGVPHYVSITAGSGVRYRVQRAGAPPAITPATDPVLRTINMSGSASDVVFSLNGASQDPYGGTVTTPTPAGPMVFNARGLPTSAGSYFLASVDGANTYAISVTGAGRMRIWRKKDATWR